MLKVTIKLPARLFFYCALGLGCHHPVNNEIETDAALHRVDSLSEVQIDSAFEAISDSCDTLKLHMVPRFADSLMKGDTVYMDKFFERQSLFVDSNQKVEKVVRQLQVDCDSNLRRETYKRALLMRRSKLRGRGRREKEVGNTKSTKVH